MTQVLPERPAPARRSAPSPRLGGLGQAAATAAPALPASRPNDNVPVHCRPSPERAAAAALLVGGPNAQPALAPDKQSRPAGHLRVVERPAPDLRRRRTVMLVSGLALAGAVAFLLVYSHVVLAQRQFAIDNLNTQVQQQQVAYQKLRLQVAQLGSPQQIISTAEGRLGMTQPASVNYLPTNTTTSGSPASQSSFGSTATSTIAPEGDADWPLIKSQLAGSP